MSAIADKLEARLIDITDELLGAQASSTTDPLGWMEGFELSADEARLISDPSWIEKGFIPEGHVVAIVAKPNGGKTTIIFHLACGWTRGNTVVYVDADTNPSDAKRKLRLAQRHGIRYLTPDLKVGKSMRDIVQHLEKLATSDVDLAGQVWIFDTLKKMANVINKDSLKQVLGLMRKLSARGMTCVLLCHTNKYKNSEGEYQYEGTGDLESDCDELIYLEPRENDDRSLTVSSRCVKRRADIAEQTWTIHADRTVTQHDFYIDIPAAEREQAQREKDETAIEVISECIATLPKKQREIVVHCAEYRINAKTARAVLKRYRGKLWRETKLPKDNALEYTLIPRHS